jgi:hypothetical protein
VLTRPNVTAELVRLAKEVGFSDNQLAESLGITAEDVRHLRQHLNVTPWVKQVPHAFFPFLFYPCSISCAYDCILITYVMTLHSYYVCYDVWWFSCWPAEYDQRDRVWSVCFDCFSYLSHTHTHTFIHNPITTLLPRNNTALCPLRAIIQCLLLTMLVMTVEFTWVSPHMWSRLDMLLFTLPAYHYKQPT